MGLSASQFKANYNKEYFDRFDYCSPEDDPYPTDAENSKYFKNPKYRDFGTYYQIYRRKHDFQGEGRPVHQGSLTDIDPSRMKYADNQYFIKQAQLLRSQFTSYVAEKAFECVHTYQDSALELCANELKRHTFLTDTEVKYKLGSLIQQHGITPVADLPSHLKYDSEEFKLWLEQNSMSMMLPLFLTDYIQELNEY